MEVEAASGKHYIHLIHTMDGTSTYYMRVTPDEAGTVYTQQVQAGSVVIGIEAVFTNTPGTIGQSNTFSGYQAYVIGALQSYTVT